MFRSWTTPCVTGGRIPQARGGGFCEDPDLTIYGHRARPANRKWARVEGFFPSPSQPRQGEVGGGGHAQPLRAGSPARLTDHLPLAQPPQILTEHRPHPLPPHDTQTRKRLYARPGGGGTRPLSPNRDDWPPSSPALRDSRPPVLSRPSQHAVKRSRSFFIEIKLTRERATLWQPFRFSLSPLVRLAGGGPSGIGRGCDAACGHALSRWPPPRGRGSFPSAPSASGVLPWRLEGREGGATSRRTRPSPPTPPAPSPGPA